MSRQMILFTAVTLTAPVLIAAAALWGGWWAVAALAFLTAITASLDEFVSFGRHIFQRNSGKCTSRQS